MYIRGLIPRKFAEFAEAVPIAFSSEREEVKPIQLTFAA